MVTAVASNANDGRITYTSETGYIGRNSSNYSAMNQNLLIFGDAAFDQTYRENVKAWCEAAPRGATFG
jgi:hypothetical protein